jgi:acyl-CoA synthetase (NDP forming)
MSDRDRTAAGVTAPLARLLRPSGIAIVGASDKVGPGFNAWRALEAVGYTGRVYLVSRSKGELLGRKTYPALSAIDDPVDAVFVAVPHEAVLDAVREAGQKGAGGVVVLSSGFGEAGADGRRRQDELVAAAESSGLALCGPNCLGFLNLTGRAALFGTSLPAELPRGGVAAVVQSGSVGIALLNAARGVGLSYLITSGNEAVVAAADYVDVLVDDPGVTVIVCFLEEVRKPERFLTAARRAYEAGKPVIVLKAGRSERGRQATEAHTGAVAGSAEVWAAAFRAAGVVTVSSLDDLLETAHLFSSVPRRPTVPGVAMVSASGGEIAVALDLAETAGLELPPIEGAAPALRGLLPDFAHCGNPLDVTWAGLYDPTVARRCAEAIGAQAQIGALVMLQDAPRGLGDQQATRYATFLRALAEGAAATGKPLVVVSNLAVDFHPAFGAVAATAQVPLLRGTPEGLHAVARLMRWATRRPEPPPAGPTSARSAAFGEAERRLRSCPPGRMPTEHEARGVLAAYGVSSPREAVARDVDQALAAARTLGYPVVVKALLPDVLHKTEAALVRLGIRSDEELRGEARSLLERAATRPEGPLLGLLVQEMVHPVAELLVGGRVDPQFGPIVVVGGGGVLVEFYRDVAVRLAPVTEAIALEMIGETRAAALLAGWRGRPAGDVTAAARVVVALSRFVSEFRDLVAEVEINPLAVLRDGEGVSALDCLIVPRRKQ